MLLKLFIFLGVELGYDYLEFEGLLVSNGEFG